MTYTPEKATGVSETWKVTLPAYCMLALTLIGIADVAYVAYGNFTCGAIEFAEATYLVASIS
ncbi:MAG: hypothetical protein WB563_19260 [Pseudolabrys sp.]|jgi:hypothetical protein